ncbi:MAG TPA: hypothetical protein VF140_06540, partial [Phycicoccus sp.]
KAADFVAREGAADPLHGRVLDLWDRVLTALETDDLGLVATEVDWVHLKLNDQAQRTVLCKDPFLAEDARVERLIEGMTA